MPSPADSASHSTASSRWRWTSAKSSRGVVPLTFRSAASSILESACRKASQRSRPRNASSIYLTLTAEPGIVGGIPQGGLDFGAALNPEAVIQQNQQFDFYDGGGLDLACLGMAQADADGNVNVSRSAAGWPAPAASSTFRRTPRSSCSRGRSPQAVFEVEITDGKLAIASEGRSRKFIDKVEQITFSGAYAAETGQPVFYVTERCVFQRTSDGMELIEIAPGSTSKRISCPIWTSNPSYEIHGR